MCLNAIARWQKCYWYCYRVITHIISVNHYSISGEDDRNISVRSHYSFCPMRFIKYRLSTNDTYSKECWVVSKWGHKSLRFSKFEYLNYSLTSIDINVYVFIYLKLHIYLSSWIILIFYCFPFQKLLIYL